MFCTSCQCIFDWQTMKIYDEKKDVIHNPEYQELQKKQNKSFSNFENYQELHLLHFSNALRQYI